MDNIQTLKDWIAHCQNIVFFGGAGVSCESGIPDFRSVNGLYNQHYDYPPETILSHTFFQKNPQVFYRFYREKMLALNALPNPAHLALVRLEEQGKLKAVVTQNIDGLHQKAGGRNVLELHGSIWRNHCVQCRQFYTAEHIAQTQGVPLCSCGGIIKPDVVLYEEALSSSILQKSVEAIEKADMLIVGGTSLAVYPAAGLVDYFHGRHLVVVNISPLAVDKRADLVISQKIGSVLGQVV